MKRPFFPTKLSIPSYEIGKLVGLMTYQQPPSYMNASLSLCTYFCLWNDWANFCQISSWQQSKPCRL